MGGSKPKGRGKDFSETFAGDIDDDFVCGMSIEESGVRFLTEWSDSDLMFLSPLRLKLILETNVIDDESALDFFSSIEVLIVEQMDIVEMQNIRFLEETLHKVGWHPKLRNTESLKRVDFERLRYCFIDDKQQYFRQNIFLAARQTPKIKALFEQRALNVFGRVKICRHASKGILERVVPSIRQTFIRFDAGANAEDVGALRLEKFKKFILPIFRRKDKGKKTAR